MKYPIKWTFLDTTRIRKNKDVNYTISQMTQGGAGVDPEENEIGV
jgi:hypothetical protein